MATTTITITIEHPDNTTVSVSGPPEAPGPAETAASGSDPARDLITAHAAPRDESLQQALLERLEVEFELVPRPPRTGDRPYLNLYPPVKYGSSRVGNIAVRSSRFYAVCDVKKLDEHLRAVPEAEIAENKYLTVYLRSNADLDVAMRLMRCAMEDRGWTDQAT